MISVRHFAGFVIFALFNGLAVDCQNQNDAFSDVNILDGRIGFWDELRFPKRDSPFFEIYFVRLIATPINYLSK